jgi:hypothetical protein
MLALNEVEVGDPPVARGFHLAQYVLHVVIGIAAEHEVHSLREFWICGLCISDAKSSS